jgi:hypothetical protein
MASGRHRVAGGTERVVDRAQVLAAIAKYGPSVQAMAEKRYGISGEALLAKLAQGESGAISDPIGRAQQGQLGGREGLDAVHAGLAPGGDQQVRDRSVGLAGRGVPRGVAAPARQDQRVDGARGLQPGLVDVSGYILGRRSGTSTAQHRGAAAARALRARPLRLGAHRPRRLRRSAPRSTRARREA